MNKPKSSPKETDVSSLITSAVIGFILGFTAYLTLSPHIGLQDKKDVNDTITGTQTPEAKDASHSKEEIIRDIINIQGLNAEPFSKSYYVQLKLDMLSLNSKSEILKDEVFWSNFLDKNAQQLKKIDHDHYLIAINFYNQFSHQELIKYYNLIRLPANSKIQKILMDNVNEDTYIGKEIKKELIDLVRKTLPQSN